MGVWVSSQGLGEKVTIWESAFSMEAFEEMNSPEEGRGGAGEEEGKMREGGRRGKCGHSHSGNTTDEKEQILNTVKLMVSMQLHEIQNISIFTSSVKLKVLLFF